MGSFAASLRAAGDRTGLPATVHVNGKRLKISIGDEVLGDWGLDEIELEPSPGGYSLIAEGDQVFLDFDDRMAFTDALPRSKKHRSRQKAEPKPQKAERKPKETRSKPQTAPKEGSAGARLLDGVDRTIAAARRRFGSLLPDWVFSRLVFGAVAAMLVVAVVFPGVVSMLLLVSGVLLVVLGAVVYTDPILMAKWLPGRMAPMHVLLFGVTVVMAGVLIGVVAG